MYLCITHDKAKDFATVRSWKASEQRETLNQNNNELREGNQAEVKNIVNASKMSHKIASLGLAFHLLCIIN